MTVSDVQRHQAPARQLATESHCIAGYIRELIRNARASESVHNSGHYGHACDTLVNYDRFCCTIRVYRRIIILVTQLCTQKTSDTIVSELKDEIAALKAEVLLLKSALAKTDAKAKQDKIAPPESGPWVTVRRQVQESSNVIIKDQMDSSRLLVGKARRETAVSYRLALRRLVATIILVAEHVLHKKEQERSGAQ